MTTTYCIPEVGDRDVRVFGCLPGQFEQQALPRVHQPRLGRRDAEERGIELVDLLEEAADQARHVTARRRASPGGHSERISRRFQEIPEFTGIVGPRQPARHTDDRDSPGKRVIPKIIHSRSALL